MSRCFVRVARPREESTHRQTLEAIIEANGVRGVTAAGGSNLRAYTLPYSCKRLLSRLGLGDDHENSRYSSSDRALGLQQG